MDKHSEDHKHEPVPFKVYFIVWAVLIFLTVVTVGISYVTTWHIPILAAVMVATVKVTLVLMYFMHIRFDKPVFTWMLLSAIGVYGIFFVLTFADYLYR